MSGAAVARGKRPPGPAADDLDLWRHITRDAKPLKGREPRPAPAPPKPMVTAPAAHGRPRAVVAPPPPSPPPAALAHGTVAGLDRRSAERMKRGRLPIERRLDLHGMTQADAHTALNGFLAACQSAGCRCVLVITGKGQDREAGGVLRRQVPLWLNQAPNRGRVLAFDYAQQRHGGQGALYVLLRRRRERD